MQQAVEYKTDVIHAYDSYEDRKSLRTLPRQSLTYTYSLLDVELATVQNKLMGYQHGEWVAPMWQHEHIESFKRSLRRC